MQNDISKLIRMIDKRANSLLFVSFIIGLVILPSRHSYIRFCVVELIFNLAITDVLSNLVGKRNSKLGFIKVGRRSFFPLHDEIGINCPLHNRPYASEK